MTNQPARGGVAGRSAALLLAFASLAVTPIGCGSDQPTAAERAAQERQRAARERQQAAHERRAFIKGARAACKIRTRSEYYGADDAVYPQRRYVAALGGLQPPAASQRDFTRILASTRAQVGLLRRLGRVDAGADPVEEATRYLPLVAAFEREGKLWVRTGVPACRLYSPKEARRAKKDLREVIAAGAGQ